MRVLHFVESYLQQTETFIYNFINSSSTIAEISIAAFHLKNLEHFPLPANSKLTHLNNDPVFIKRKPHKWPEYFYYKISGKRKWYDQLNKFITEEKPDVVHCHFGTIGIDFAKFVQYYKIKVPFITSFYGYDASQLPLTNPQYKKDLFILWHEATKLLAEGPELSNKLANLGAPRDKLAISPIIVDSSLYPRKKSCGSEISPLRFLLIGRFVEKKGFHLFFEAIGKIKMAIPPFEIVVIGSGPMEGEYKQIITQYKLESHINFKGPQPLSVCIQEMLEADVLVHPSVTASNGDSEGGAPTILIEAQMIGLPVISSNHADIPAIMGYHDFLAKEGDVTDLINVIQKFISEKHIENKSEQGWEFVLKRHDMNRSPIYKEILINCANFKTKHSL